jgi:hypothetical protein
MAQSDQVVQNATFPSVRADINDNLAALFSQSSGNSAPSVTVAFQPWVDTSSSPPVWKVRNGSNSAWITVGVLDPAGFQVGGITPIANGGTGTTTAALALAALLPSQSGNTGKSLVTDGSATSWATASGITSGTAVASTSGTSIDFINIPAGVKRVTVMFNGVSTSAVGTSPVLVQIGSGSISSSGYISYAGVITNTNTTSVSNYTAGFAVTLSMGNPSIIYGQAILTLISSNIWVYSSVFGGLDGASSVVTRHGGGTSPNLSGTLDRVRITTVNGTDTFDAGSINILYEA